MAHCKRPLSYGKLTLKMSKRDRIEENYRTEMHVMMVPSGKIWKVYTAGAHFYLPMRGRQPTTHTHIYIHTQSSGKHTNVTGGNRSC